jgi:hypothetical protein
LKSVKNTVFYKKSHASYLVEITNKRQFKNTTGYDKATFAALFTDFTVEYKIQNSIVVAFAFYKIIENQLKCDQRK